MLRFISAFALFVAITAATASSDAITQEPRTFRPYSETAVAITGPVVLSTDRMFFETGAFLELENISHAASGDWGVSGGVATAQLYRVSGRVGPLRQGNPLCGAEPITYLAAWEESGSGSGYLGIAMFTGTDMPSGVKDPDICAIYFYSTGDE